MGTLPFLDYLTRVVRPQSRASFKGSVVATLLALC